MLSRVNPSRAFARLRAAVTAALLLMIVALAVSPAFAATYFVGPKGTPTGGNGTQALPFASIGAAIASGKVIGGDTLMLLDGAYGEVIIKSFAPASPVLIESMNPGKAVFDRIAVENKAKNLTFSKVSISWSKAPATTGALFSNTWDTNNISLLDSTLMAHPGGADFRTWTMAEWKARAISGISMRGGGGQILRNTVIGVAAGINLNTSDMRIEGNTVDGYSNDGLRGNGNRLVFRNNRVTNCVSIDGNHADAFQSFNLDATKVFDGIVLDGNTIIETTFSPRLPLTCTLQGIGMFDGMFGNLVITGNYVEVSNYHGITVTGVVGALIDGNTVVQAPGGPHKPWIMVMNHKDGRKSSNVTISNNVAVAGIRGPFAPGLNNTLSVPAPVPAPTPVPPPPVPAPAPAPVPASTPATPLPPALVLSGTLTLAEMCAAVQP